MTRPDASAAVPLGKSRSTALRVLKAARVSERIQIASVSYISLWSIAPPLLENTLARALAVTAVALFFLVELATRPLTLLRPSVPMVVVLIYLIYSNLVTYYVDGPSLLVRNLPLSIFLLFTVISEVWRNDVDRLRPVFWVTLVTMPVWMAITLAAIVSKHNVARLLIRSNREAAELGSQGVGGYALIYAALACVPILFFLLRYKAIKSRPGNLLMVVTGVLCIAVVLYGGYSIAVILLAVAFFLGFLVDRIQSHLILRFLFVGLVLAPSTYFLAPLLADIAKSVAHGTLYEHKVNDMIATFGQDRDVGTVRDRTARYQRSVELFKSSPVTGVLSVRDVGKHSAIMDRFAMYGIAFGSMFVYILAYLPIRYMKRRKSRASGLALALAAVALPFALLNNLYPAFGSIVFLLFPVAVDYLEEEERRVAGVSPVPSTDGLTLAERSS